MTSTTYNILVADDEPSVQSLLENILLKEGYNVILAGNGQEAVNRFRQYSPELILLDVRMPVMDGLEAFKIIRQENQEVLIIMITAYGTIETAVQAMKMGAFDYLVKPFNLEELKVVIKKALEMYSMSSELRTLRREFADKYNLQNIVFKSKAMQEVLNLADIVSKSDATVLLRGESGTGKDLLARYIHSRSARAQGPFIKIHCGALPETLVESELFGYERGAFTGATTRKPGKFELARGGTLFLDEIGEISPSIQVKLLHALQYKEFERLGGTETLKTDARLIAATNKNLEEAMSKKEFREDLFYRLNVIPIYLPPLRERKEDLPHLVDYFVGHFCQKLKRPPLTVSQETITLLTAYDWPGNIRELENTIERAVILSTGPQITPQVLPRSINKYKDSQAQFFITPTERPLRDVMADIEKQIIKKVLQETGGNRSKAAEKLGISRRALHYKLVEYGFQSEE
ncbi:response regulator [Thermanaerosceptrum fracticalcis]|uniref:Stage 0 sporulation protein A homolog n=1 Tax=Thermanaerosceptrum fracticalcis TaxID=1712410 RepID=A0A7G6E2G7_THEFR|nr:sigma-54 dependent transcriptional regulator [Thermanaerosceptrum fracticalcis]QNB46271.1 response regulator [Thermanaerosceptrum fracticalcis]